MDVQLNHAGIELDGRRFLALKDAKGARVLCVAGELWITQDGDTTDHILGPGAAFEIGVDGAVLVHGLRASRLLLLEKETRPSRGFRGWFGVRRIESRPPVAVLLHGA